jgi:precorrin-6A/cobalt-precorrin-6A reductase
VRLLLLGGTGEARSLAEALVADGVDVVSSLAGRVQRPRLPVGQLRVGGFGGVDGLRDEVVHYDAVVDATHPFAATISASAATACRATGVPLLRLARPGWSGHPDAGAWHWAGSHEEAAGTAASLGRSVFLTTGRQTLPRFGAALAGHRVLVRVVDPVDHPVPAAWTVLLARGPYTRADEGRLMREHAIDVLVSKDSGGEQTRAKLDVAAGLGVAVVVVRRPTAPEDVPEVSDVAGAVRWLQARRG